MSIMNILKRNYRKTMIAIDTDEQKDATCISNSEVNL
jgi:hypothetical protein